MYSSSESHIIQLWISIILVCSVRARVRACSALINLKANAIQLCVLRAHKHLFCNTIESAMEFIYGETVTISPFAAIYIYSLGSLARRLQAHIHLCFRIVYAYKRHLVSVCFAMHNCECRNQFYFMLNVLCCLSSSIDKRNNRVKYCTTGQKTNAK